MSFNLHCCSGMNIRKFLCNCNGHGESKRNKEEQLLYTDAAKQIVILSTPQLDFPDLVRYDDIKRTDVVVFSLDGSGDICFSSVQGMNMFRTLQAEEKVPEQLAGGKMEDQLPSYMTRFLKPIYTQTLQGNYLQLTIMWLNATHLLRTFPIVNHKKQIIAGMAITSPFDNAFNGDINRFSLNPPSEQSQIRKRSRIKKEDLKEPDEIAYNPSNDEVGPRSQVMTYTKENLLEDGNHSGILRNSNSMKPKSPRATNHSAQNSHDSQISEVSST